MRRDPALVPISKFHRSVLFLALLLKRNSPPLKGYPTDIEGKRNYTIEFFNNQLRNHFKQEEEFLFEGVKGKTEDIDDLINDLKREHVLMLEKVESLNHSFNLVEDMNELGILLENHVRKEERELFQKIQTLFSTEELLSILS